MRFTPLTMPVAILEQTRDQYLKGERGNIWKKLYTTKTSTTEL